MFEYIYFLRENTLADNINVKEFREKCGEKLAEYDIDKFDDTYLKVHDVNSQLAESNKHILKNELKYQYQNKTQLLKIIFLV